ncbi:hypothetical protein GGG16DRAFT_98316 [Schizophyllum commune]|nr:uncharacterized protein SCHCODRAFT_02698109 [Schizophyllum commune H4-8]KAI4525239.1 hypothetical protein K525DRAFT_261661 [Schizophyllum commune Loenen D]KAI5896749.1 hypothetical protein SCHCODRAFT_02698109 [Schizophyllum commune H4-8]
MGFTFPSSQSDRTRAVKELMSQKEATETLIEEQASILKSNNATMRSPLVDADGFPRDDMDIYAVRGARVRIIELRNDLDDLMNKIGKALEGVYDPALIAPKPSEDDLRTFAKVNAVAPGSPAADAGLQKDDLIVKFGHLTHKSLTGGSLQPIAELVNANENRHVVIKLLRSGETIFANLYPRQGWGGRGMLGCHIVPA